MLFDIAFLDGTTVFSDLVPAFVFITLPDAHAGSFLPEQHKKVTLYPSIIVVISMQVFSCTITGNFSSESQGQSAPWEVPKIEQKGKETRKRHLLAENLGEPQFSLREPQSHVLNQRRTSNATGLTSCTCKAQLFLGSSKNRTQGEKQKKGILQQRTLQNRNLA